MNKSVLVLIIVVVAMSGSPAGAAEKRSAPEFRTASGLCAKGKYGDALALYRKMLASPPPGVAAGDIQSRIGDVYFRIGDFGNALNSYRKALGDPLLADRPQTQYWVGFCCFLTGRDAEAVAELLKVPALYPDAKAWGTTAYYWAGRASERMGKKAQAAEFYRKAGGKGGTTQGKFALKKAEKLNGN
jgi:tetratricopeptide (TPR) repeat protein